MKHKTILQLRDDLKKVLKRARPKQLKKLRKAYHGKRLKKWWSDYANADGCNTIAELKDFEGAGHRMKGGHRHNHVRNARFRGNVCPYCDGIIVKGCGERRYDGVLFCTECAQADYEGRRDRAEYLSHIYG